MTEAKPVPCGKSPQKCRFQAPDLENKENQSWRKRMLLERKKQKWPDEADHLQKNGVNWHFCQRGFQSVKMWPLKIWSDPPTQFKEFILGLKFTQVLNMLLFKMAKRDQLKSPLIGFWSNTLSYNKYHAATTHNEARLYLRIHSSVTSTALRIKPQILPYRALGTLGPTFFPDVISCYFSPYQLSLSHVVTSRSPLLHCCSAQNTLYDVCHPI